MVIFTVSLYTQITSFFFSQLQLQESQWQLLKTPQNGFSKFIQKSAFAPWWSLRKLSRQDDLLNKANIFASHLEMQSSCDRRAFSKPMSVLVLSALFCLFFSVDYSQLLTYICFSFGKGKGKSRSWCLTLWDPRGYTVHGTLQARMLEWVAFPFSRRSSQPRDLTQVSHIASSFFTSWATREAQDYWSG